LPFEREEFSLHFQVGEKRWIARRDRGKWQEQVTGRYRSQYKSNQQKMRQQYFLLISNLDLP
jgi:hypothetical protein